jgi:hypothetical protein
VEFVTTPRTDYLKYSEWLRMRIIACEDVSTPPADPAGCYNLQELFEFKLTPKLSGRKCEIVQNSVGKP